MSVTPLQHLDTGPISLLGGHMPRRLGWPSLSPSYSNGEESRKGSKELPFFYTSPTLVTCFYGPDFRIISEAHVREVLIASLLCCHRGGRGL